MASTDATGRTRADGSDKPVCGARLRQGEPGQTCLLMAGQGTDHVGFGRCRLHGGNTRNQKAAAHAEKANWELGEVLAELEVRPVDDPLTALTRLAGQVVSFQEAASILVNRLGDKIRYAGATGTEQLRAEVQLYERAMDRAAHVLGLIAKLNIEERLAAVTEQQAERVIASIDAVLAHLGVTGPQADEARQVAARHLSVVPDTA